MAMAHNREVRISADVIIEDGISLIGEEGGDGLGLPERLLFSD